MSEKRTDALDWDTYFMALAFLAAKRSKDPQTQTGACIVNENKRVVGTGYNGMAQGCSDDVFPWGKSSTINLDTKYPYVCHSAMNAIANKNEANLHDCKIYVVIFPCNECTKLIIQSGIKEIIFMSDKYAHKDTTKAAKRMLAAANIKLTPFIPKVNKIEINFSEVDWDLMEYD